MVKQARIYKPKLKFDGTQDGYGGLGLVNKLESGGWGSKRSHIGL